MLFRASNFEAYRLETNNISLFKTGRPRRLFFFLLSVCV